MQKYRVREQQHEELLHDLLAARGVVGDESKKLFLSPDFFRDSHDPFLLPDMGKAVERIVSAAKYNQQICVWSDYDADGIPGGVMLTQFLCAMGLSVRHYIPHRHKEGYGLNIEGIDELKTQNTSLIITIDLGTTNHQEILHAQKSGIDVIVTDHHIVSTEDMALSAFALINPKRPDSTYPFDGLCGAGVAWKLVQALLETNRPQNFGEGQEKWLLDLVGIATLSDMVPLVDENRMLAHFGLTVMRSSGWVARRPGLASLLSLLRIKPHTLTEDDIGFMVSPRINAASRMDSPGVAARLLAATEAVEGAELAKTLNKINDERKGLVAATVKEVNKRIAQNDALVKSPLIVMGNPNWRPGILGLVANNLVEKYGKPVFLWGREGGEVIRGSVRSDGVLNVVELMGTVPEMFEHFGGHAASGGFSVSEEKIHELPAHLAAAYEKVLSTATVKEVVVDRELDLAEVPFAKKEISRLAPFGVGNTKPLFIFPNTTVGNVRTFGKANDHLELTFTNASTPLGVGGVAFFSNADSFEKKVEKGSRVDIVGHVEADWRGAPRIRIVDLL